MNPKFLIQDLCTQGFHIIDGFLAEEHCCALRAIAEVRYNQGLFHRAQIGLKVESHRNEAIRTDHILWVDPKDNPKIDIFLERIQFLAHQLNHSLFLSLTEFETHFAYYQPGTFYKKHVDQFAKQKNRKISFVYYLNKHWKDEYGGALTLYNNEGVLLQRVMPLENRFICFNSELPHEVATTHHCRYSITGWMKTRI
jgi:SM-20-related protein